MPPVYMPSEDRHLYAVTYSGSAFGRPSHGLRSSSTPVLRMVLSLAAVTAFGALVLFVCGVVS